MTCPHILPSHSLTPAVLRELRCPDAGYPSSLPISGSPGQLNPHDVVHFSGQRGLRHRQGEQSRCRDHTSGWPTSSASFPGNELSRRLLRIPVASQPHVPCGTINPSPVYYPAFPVDQASCYTFYTHSLNPPEGESYYVVYSSVKWEQ